MITKLTPPKTRTRIITYLGRKVVAIRWDRGCIVLDFDGPNDKSLILKTDDVFDEDGMRLDYEGTA